MVRRLASLAVPLILAGILLVTIVLSFIGFRSVKNEEWIAEKNYESARMNLKNAIAEASENEIGKIIKEVQKLALGEDFLRDSIPGILSVFIFKNGNLVYPSINEEEQSEVYLLETSDALLLKDFLDMQTAGKFAESRNYVLQQVDLFLKNSSLAHLDWDSYALEKMLNDILSHENLSKAEREKIWATLSETKRFLRILNTYREHKSFLLALGNYASYSNEGRFFIHNDGKTFLTLSYPDAAVKSAIVTEVDSVFYTKQMNNTINETAKEWSYINYSIVGEFPFGHWDISIEENSVSAKKEFQKKKNFLYLMLALFLLIPAIGVVVVYRVFSRERQLRQMKDNFLSTISHELKTPLAIIDLYTGNMLKKPEKIAYYAEVISKSSKRLNNLIGDVLDYTSLESGKRVFRMESMDLSECVNKVCDSLSVISSNKNLEIKREVEADCTIAGDYESVYSIVQNLVDNAIKYTSEGYILVKLQTDWHEALFSVTDTGKGIPMNEQKNIFESFYRVGDELTRETKGSGLGLAIVKRNADAHKAQVLLKSTPGKGSTFTVVFKKN